MSSVEPTVAAAISEENTKRPREEEPVAEAEAGVASAASSSRPVPPPLKFATTEAVAPSAAPSSDQTPKAPAPMVRIKSRASLSSPTTPALAAGLVVTSSSSTGLVINTSPPATLAPSGPSLKILSPTLRSPATAAAGPRFGSPTTASPKSPSRYSSFSAAANPSAAAASVASQDPRVRYVTLFTRTLSKDADTDETTCKAAASDIADAMMKVPDAVRTDRIKSVLHHLSDDKNKALRESIRTKAISGEDLVNMDVRKLMNPEKQQEVTDKVAWAEKDRNLTELAAAKKITSTMYECPKCKKRDCTFYEKQTRSADEPMTQFINCNVCKYNWKIY